MKDITTKLTNKGKITKPTKSLSAKWTLDSMKNINIPEHCEQSFFDSVIQSTVITADDVNDQSGSEDKDDMSSKIKLATYICRIVTNHAYRHDFT